MKQDEPRTERDHCYCYKFHGVPTSHARDPVSYLRWEVQCLFSQILETLPNSLRALLKLFRHFASFIYSRYSSPSPDSSKGQDRTGLCIIYKTSSSIVSACNGFSCSCRALKCM